MASNKFGKNQGVINVGVQLGFNEGAMGKTVKQVDRSMQQMAARTRAAGKAISQTQRVAIGGFGASLAAAFAFGARAAVAFEDQFASVKKTLDVKGEGAEVERAFQGIAQEIRAIAKFSPAAVAELTQIAAVGGQLGIAASDIVRFTDTIQKLTVATNMGAEQAALSLARLQKITGLASSEIDNLASVLVKLGNNFATTESEIMTAATQIATATAGTATEFNNAAVDALAYATALRAIGQPAQAGSTAIIRMVQVIDRLVSVGGNQLQIVAQTAGMTADAFRNLQAVDPNFAMAEFIAGLGRVEEEGGDAIAILQELGLGQIRTRRAVMALARAKGELGGQVVPLLTEALAMANFEFVENQALLTEAERRYETVASQLKILKNVFTESGIAFGVKFLPALNDTVKGFINVVTAIGDLDKATKKMATWGIAITGFIGIAGAAARGYRVMTSESLSYAAALKTVAANQTLVNGISKTGGGLGAFRNLAGKHVSYQTGPAGSVHLGKGMPGKGAVGYQDETMQMGPGGTFTRTPDAMLTGPVATQQAGLLFSRGGAVATLGKALQQQVRNMTTSISQMFRKTAGFNASFMAEMNKDLDKFGVGISKFGGRMKIFSPIARDTAKQLAFMAKTNRKAFLSFIRLSGVLKGATQDTESVMHAINGFNRKAGNLSMRVLPRLVAGMQGLATSIKMVRTAMLSLVKMVGRIIVPLLLIQEVFSFFEKIGARKRAIEEFSSGLAGIVDTTLDVEKASKRLEALKMLRDELELEGADASTIDNIDMLIKQADVGLKAGQAQIQMTASDLAADLALNSKNPEGNLEKQLRTSAAVLGRGHEEFKDIMMSSWGKLISDIDNNRIPTVADAITSFVGTDFGDEEVNEAMQAIESQVGLLDAMKTLFPRGTAEHGFTPDDYFDSKFTGMGEWWGRTFGQSEEEIAKNLADTYENVSIAARKAKRDDGQLGAIIMGLTEEDQQHLLQVLDSFGDTLSTFAGMKLEDLAEGDLFTSASVLFQAKTKFLNDQQKAFVKAGLMDQADQVDAVKSYSRAVDVVMNITRKNAGEATEQLEGIKDELGLTEVAFAGVGAAIDQNMVSQAQAAMNLFMQMPEAIRKSAEMATANLIENLRTQNEFEKDILNLSIFAPLLALELAKQGPASREVVKDFLDNTFLAGVAESHLLSTAGPEMASSAREAINDAISSGELTEAAVLGADVADGIISGVKNKVDELKAVFEDAVEAAIEAAELAADTGSPSMQMYHRVGVPMIDGIIAPFFDKRNELMKAVTTTIAEVITKAQQQWAIYTALTTSKIAQVNANKALITSEQELNAQNRRRITVLEDLERAQKNLVKLEVSGRAGNITLDEEISLLRQKISLEDKIKSADGNKSAKELLAIQKAEENIGDLRAMAAKGVISNLELQAAEEDLARLKGTDVTEDERQLMILELAQAEKQLQEAREKAVEVDDDLINARKEVITLTDELAVSDHTYELAELAVAAAKNAVVDADLALEAARERFREEMRSDGGYIADLKLITDSYTFMEGAIDKVLSKEGLIGGTVTNLEAALSAMQGFTELEFGEPYEVQTPETSVDTNGWSYTNSMWGPGNMYQNDYTPGGRVNWFDDYRAQHSSGATVQNLNVNVTGVPSDPIAARKAAQQISKALNNLDKEGSSGTSIRRD